MYFHFKWFIYTPPFSTFRVGEKIEDVLFEVKFLALNKQWCVCVLVLRFQGAVFQLRDTNR